MMKHLPLFLVLFLVTPLYAAVENYSAGTIAYFKGSSGDWRIAYLADIQATLTNRVQASSGLSASDKAQALDALGQLNSWLVARTNSTKGTIGLGSTSLTVGGTTATATVLAEFDYFTTPPESDAKAGAYYSVSYGLAVTASSPVSVSLNLDKSSQRVPKGSNAASVTLAWSSSNATSVSVTGSNGFSSNASSGSQTVSGLGIGTYTYTITAQGFNGPATATQSFKVDEDAAKKTQTISLYVNDSSSATVTPGSTVTFSLYGGQDTYYLATSPSLSGFPGSQAYGSRVFTYTVPSGQAVGAYTVSAACGETSEYLASNVPQVTLNVVAPAPGTVLYADVSPSGAGTVSIDGGAAGATASASGAQYRTAILTATPASGTGWAFLYTRVYSDSGRSVQVGGDNGNPAQPWMNQDYYARAFFKTSPQTVTLSASSTSVTAGGSVTFTASGGKNGYSWSGSASGSGASKTLSFPSAGSYTVTASSPAGNGWDVSNTASVTITVAEAQKLTPPTVSSANGTITYGQSFTPQLNGGASGLIWRWSLDGTASWNSPGTWSPAVSTLSPGSYGFYVQQVGNATYTDSNLAGQYTLTVTKAPQAPVTITPISQTITAGGSITFTASGGSGTGAYVWGAYGSVASGTGTTKAVSFPTAGTFTVAVYRNADTNYTDSDPAFATVTVVSAGTTLYADVSPSGAGTVSIDGGAAGATASASGAQYRTANLTATPASGSGYAFLYTRVYSDSGRTAQVGGDNGNPAQPWMNQDYYARVFFKTSPQTVTLSASSSSVTPGGSVTITASGGKNGYSWSGSASGSGASKTLSFPSAGSYTVTASSPAGNGWDVSNNASVTITVAEAQKLTPPTVSSSNGTITQGQGFLPALNGGASGLTWRWSLDGTASWNSPGTWSPAVSTLSPGSYGFYVQQVGNSQYTDSNLAGPYTLTVLAPGTTLYADVSPSGAGTVSIDGGAAGATASASGAQYRTANLTATPASGSGYAFLYTRVYSDSGRSVQVGGDNGNPAQPWMNQDYYARAFFKTSPQTVTLSASSTSVTAGGSVTVTASGGKNGYSWGASASGSGASKTLSFPSAGSYTVTASSPAGNGWDVSNTASVTITVAEAGTTLYADVSPSGAGTVSIDGGAAGATASASGAQYRTANLTATPASGSGYAFLYTRVYSDSGRSVQVGGDNGNPALPWMNQDYYARAFFRTSPQTVTLSASSTSVTAGGSVTITAAGGKNGYSWGASAYGSGDSKTLSFPSAGSYTVTVLSPAGRGWELSNTATLELTVQSPTPPTAVLQCQPTKVVVARGATATTQVLWTSADASAVLVSGSGANSSTLQGSLTVGGLGVGTHQFSLTAKGPGGEVGRTATFVVSEQEPTMIALTPLASNHTVADPSSPARGRSYPRTWLENGMWTAFLGRDGVQFRASGVSGSEQSLYELQACEVGSTEWKTLATVAASGPAGGQSQADFSVCLGEKSPAKPLVPASYAQGHPLVGPWVFRARIRDQTGVWSAWSDPVMVSVVLPLKKVSETLQTVPPAGDEGTWYQPSREKTFNWSVWIP